jgi:hypothetical protein
VAHESTDIELGDRTVQRPGNEELGAGGRFLGCDLSRRRTSSREQRHTAENG